MAETLQMTLGARDPLRLEAEATDRITEIVAAHARNHERVLVVCSTQRSCRETVRTISESSGITAACSHGGMGTVEREGAEAAFADGNARILAVVGGSLTARPAARLRSPVVIVKGSHRYAGQSRFAPYSESERRVFASHATRLCIEIVAGRQKKTGGVESGNSTRQVRSQPIKAAASHEELLGAAAEGCAFRFRPVPQDVWLVARGSVAVRLRPRCSSSAVDNIAVGCQLVLSDAFGADWPRSFVLDCTRATSAAAKSLSRLLRTIPKRSGTALRNAIELLGALRARAWHDDAPRILTQIEGIGSAYATRLIAAGLDTPLAVANAGAGKVQALLGRAPPFGQGVVASASALPRVQMVAEMSDGTLRALSVRWILSPGADVHILVVADDRALFVRQAASSGSAEVRVPKSAQSVVVSAMCESHSGLNVHRVIPLDSGSKRNPNAPKRPRVALRQSTIEETMPAKMRQAKGCMHRCGDRQACGHACCKAVPTPFGSHKALVSWLSQFRCAPDEQCIERRRALESYLVETVPPYATE